MFWDTFLNILAIVGVIVVGAIIVYLIANLVLTGLNKNNNGCEDEGVKKAKVKSKEKTVRPTVLDTNELDENYDLEQEKQQTWSDEKAMEEQNLSKVSSNLSYDTKPVEPKKAEQDFDSFDDIFNEKEEEKKESEVDSKQLDALITKINVESVAEYNELKKSKKVAENEAKVEKVEAKPVVITEEESVIEEQPEEYKQQKEEVVEDKTQVAQKIENEEEEVDYEQEKAELDEERKQLAEEQAKIEAQKADLEEQRKQLEEEIKRLEELKEEQSNVVVVSDMNSIYANETLEQLEARLEMLNERLRANKKDLRDNKKEYGPLARVKKTLEKDKAKLNRKEAIVARQKVILYGVNNYVDIDEEKAKKLNEDLDLLDGLRLSVQHCEEVMNANKDRFPILEKTNKILRKVNAEILADIAEVERAIEEKKSKIEE